jgi:hypothetical protein
MIISERLRKEAESEKCVPLTPLLNAAADHIERLEKQIELLRDMMVKM